MDQGIQLKQRLWFFTLKANFQHISKVLKSRTKKCNIISVDWHAGAEPPYDQAIANARVVALEIIYFLKFLKVSKLYHFFR